MKPDLLALIPVKDEHREMIARHFEVHHVPDVRDQTPERLAGYVGVRAILTNGAVGCRGDLLGVLPKVELICAMGLLLAAVRGIVPPDAYTRAGGWRDTVPAPPSILRDLHNVVLTPHVSAQPETSYRERN